MIKKIKAFMASYKEKKELRKMKEAEERQKLLKDLQREFLLTKKEFEEIKQIEEYKKKLQEFKQLKKKTFPSVIDQVEKIASSIKLESSKGNDMFKTDFLKTDLNIGLVKDGKRKR